MKRSRISKFGVVMAVLLLLGVTIARLHHRVIVSGQFLGLEIGATKEAVARSILDSNRFNSIGLWYCGGVSVTRRNIGDLRKVTANPVIAISTSKYIAEFEVKGSVITKVQEGVRNHNFEFRPGQSLSELENFLKGVLKNDAYAVVYAPPFCGQDVSLDDLNSDSTRTLLAESDIWNLGEIKRYTTLRLFFVDNILVEIDFRNYFTELP